MLDTKGNIKIDSKFVVNHLNSLVNQFFKILPIRENNDESLIIYLQRLQVELLGCQSLIIALNHDALYLSLISTLQYLIDNPDCSVKSVRREVFNAISVCNKLKSMYAKA